MLNFIKHIKKAFFVILLFFLSFTTVYGQEVFIANQSVELNGLPFHSVAPLLNINDRLMVPFREFGYALGATVDWEGDLARITMFRGNMYSILHIGSDVVVHGEFIITSAGTPQFTSQNNSTMDSPAVLHNGLTYIPLRAVAESLGAYVGWNAATNTATITATTFVALPEPADPGGSAQNYGGFSNTPHFNIISSRQAQARYNYSGEHPFILVVYDSANQNSHSLVPIIQDSAQRVDYRIFGLDKSSPFSIDHENNWIWNFAHSASFQEPAMLFVHNRNHVEVVMQPVIAQSGFDFDSAIINFRTANQTGFTPGDFGNTAWFTNIGSDVVFQMNSRGEEFVFVLYDSRTQNSHFYIPIIKAAAQGATHRVWAVDIATDPLYRNNLAFAPGFTPNIDQRLPMVFSVYSVNNAHNTTVTDRPNSISAASALIETFLQASIFYTSTTTPSATAPDTTFVDIDHVNFRNSSAGAILNMFNRGENFVVVVYDSQFANTIPVVQAMRDGALATQSGAYAVNLSSNTVNHAHDDLSWLRLVWGNNVEITDPVIIHFRSFTPMAAPAAFSQTNSAVVQRDVQDFIMRAMLP